jgi:hypothetical protein
MSLARLRERRKEAETKDYRVFAFAPWLVIGS